MKSEDEEEELAAADRREEEEEDEEVDEAELEAFLDGQLAERLPFLQQEGSRQGIAIENQEHGAFCLPNSKAEDALRTCKFHVKGTGHQNYTYFSHHHHHQFWLNVYTITNVMQILLHNLRR